jgi:lysophospholipid acyltransferase (LPLAT)-like uncharacterized protein
MRLSRRLLERGFVQHLLARLAAAYLRLVYATNRWRRIGFEAALARATEGGRSAAVACFWHGRMLMMPFARAPSYHYAIVISSHRDGRLISRAVAHLGIETIVGSTSRGATAATKACVERLRRGSTVICITPDGPRGPRMRASPGAIEMARLAGVRIVPIGYSVTRRRVFRSWDRFILPLPFGRGVLICGEAIDPAGMDRDAACRLLEQRLNAVCAEADRLTGHAPIAPAETAAPAIGVPAGSTAGG